MRSVLSSTAVRRFAPKARRSSAAPLLSRIAALVLAGVIGGVSAGCGLAAYPAPTVSLRVQGNVADAHVTIDDIPVGALAFVAAHGVALPPGKHRITVERAGYFPWDAVVEANEEPIALQIKLVPVPD